MGALDKLKLSDKTPHKSFSTPEAHLRRNFLRTLDLQIAAAEAEAKGEVYIRREKRWIADPETGEKFIRKCRFGSSRGGGRTRPES